MQHYKSEDHLAHEDDPFGKKRIDSFVSSHPEVSQINEEEYISDFSRFKNVNSDDLELINTSFQIDEFLNIVITELGLTESLTFYTENIKSQFLNALFSFIEKEVVVNLSKTEAFSFREFCEESQVKDDPSSFRSLVLEYASENDRILSLMDAKIPEFVDFWIARFRDTLSA